MEAPRQDPLLRAQALGDIRGSVQNYVLAKASLANSYTMKDIGR
jgi:hypothetical protein